MEQKEGVKVNGFAQAAIIMAAASFIQLFGIEKALIAIIFAFFALRQAQNSSPASKKIAYVAIAIAVLYVFLIASVISTHFADIKNLLNSMKDFK